MGKLDQDGLRSELGSDLRQSGFDCYWLGGWQRGLEGWRWGQV